MAASPLSLAVGNASANESRVATSFLFGLLRLGVFADDLATLLISCSCLILRLSFFEEGNRGSDLVVLEEEDFLRMDFRGCLVRDGGAYNC